MEESADVSVAIGSLEDWAARRPDDIAIVEGDRTLTFGEWNRCADQLAEGLVRRGVGRGDIIGVRTRNCLEWPIISAAIGKLGARLLAVNARLTPGETDFILENSSATVLILDDPLGDPSSRPEPGGGRQRRPA